jgi:hypothetical protein
LEDCCEELEGIGVREGLFFEFEAGKAMAIGPGEDMVTR